MCHYGITNAVYLAGLKLQLFLLRQCKELVDLPESTQLLSGLLEAIAALVHLANSNAGESFLHAFYV